MEPGHSIELNAEPSVGPGRRSHRGTHTTAEYVLVGGGLQNALIALALLDQRPDTALTLIEREPELGGNHTWCFHAGDVPEAARGWVDGLVVKRWPSHDVVFPQHRRRLNYEYSAVTSSQLHRVVTERVAASRHARIVTASVGAVGRSSVTLDDGSTVRGQLVIDARGPAQGASSPTGAYQKFLGLELEVAANSTPRYPVLMDATVAQLDGFRFMYVLPWAGDRVLIEDTYYSTNDRLDAAALTGRIFEYAAQQGLRVHRVLREERGILPIPTRLQLQPRSTSPIRAGYAGGLFHPTTGYSLPVALRFALHIASRPARAALDQSYSRWLAQHERQLRFSVWLNRLLFGAFAPEQRCHVLERFYRLPVETILRFYALETTGLDRARILCGRPPSGFSLRRLLAGEQLS